MLNKNIFNINYKQPNDSEWKVLKLKESYFERTDTYCIEWYSEEIREHFYASLNINEDDFDDVTFELEYWDGIVMPIYRHFNK